MHAGSTPQVELGAAEEGEGGSPRLRLPPYPVDAEGGGGGEGVEMGTLGSPRPRARSRAPTISEAAKDFGLTISEKLLNVPQGAAAGLKWHAPSLTTAPRVSFWRL